MVAGGENFCHELEEVSGTTTTPSWEPARCLTGSGLICSLIANLSFPVPADGLPHPAQHPSHLSAALTTNKLGPVARRGSPGVTLENHCSQWGTRTGSSTASPQRGSAGCRSPMLIRVWD